MTTAAQLMVRVGADISDFGDKINSVQSRMEGLGHRLQGAGFALTAGITAPVTAMGVAAVSAASNLEESMNKVNVVFGGSAGQVQQWATTSAESFGLSRQAALEAAGTFGNLFSAMGIGVQPAQEMSQSLVQLAADLASFNNISVDEALIKLRAGLVGEMEPLRTLGVNLNAAAVKAKALEMGLADVTGELSPAALAQARYALILEQTATAQGDFARTSDSLANQQRILKARLGDLGAEMGSRLLPLVVRVVEGISRLVEWFTNLPAPVQNAIMIFAGIAAVIGPILMAVGTMISALAPLAGLFGAIGGAVGAAAAAIGAALGPVLLIIAAVAAAVLAFKLAWDSNFLGIRDTLQAVWAAIQPVFEAIRQIVGSVMAFLRGEISFEEMVSRVQAQLVVIRDAIVNAFTVIRDWLAGIWEQIKTVVFNALVGLVEGMGINHEQAVAIVTNAWERIKGFVQAAIEYVRGIIEMWATVITTIIQGAWIIISEYTRAAWETLKLVIENAILAIKTIIVATLMALSGDWAGAWELMKTNALTIVTNIKDGVLGILADLVSGVYERGQALAERFGEGIRSALGRVLDAVRSIVQQIRDLLPGSDAKKGPLRDLFASGRALPETFARGMRGGVRDVKDAAVYLAQIAKPAVAATRPFEPAKGPPGKDQPWDKPQLWASRPFVPVKPPAGSDMPWDKPMAQTQKPTQCITINIYNPTGTPSEASIMHALKQLAAVGVLQPVTVN